MTSAARMAFELDLAPDRFPWLATPFAADGLVLGRWQRIFLLEWDGPRARRLLVSSI